MYIRIHVYMYIYICIYVYMYICIYVHICIYVQMRMRVNVYVYIHTYVYMYVHVFMSARISLPPPKKMKDHSRSWSSWMVQHGSSMFNPKKSCMFSYPSVACILFSIDVSHCIEHTHTCSIQCSMQVDFSQFRIHIMGTLRYAAKRKNIAGWYVSPSNWQKIKVLN